MSGIPVNASKIPETNLVNLKGVLLIIPIHNRPTIRPIATIAPETALVISIRLKVARAIEFSTASSIAM